MFVHFFCHLRSSDKLSSPLQCNIRLLYNINALFSNWLPATAVPIYHKFLSFHLTLSFSIYHISPCLSLSLSLFLYIYICIYPSHLFKSICLSHLFLFIYLSFFPAFLSIYFICSYLSIFIHYIQEEVYFSKI